MTKAEIIDKVAEEAMIPRAAAERAINAFIRAVIEVLEARDKITLPGFGTFLVSNRSARRGRNPRTGEEIDIPAATIPKFRVGKSLRDLVNLKVGPHGPNGLPPDEVGI